MKSSIVVAGSVIGISLIISSCILSWNIRQMGSDFRKANVFMTSPAPRFPDTLTLRSGNGRFKVQLCNDLAAPIVVEQKTAK